MPLMGTRLSCTLSGWMEMEVGTVFLVEPRLGLGLGLGLGLVLGLELELGLEVWMGLGLEVWMGGRVTLEELRKGKRA
jgi:hypothetical protein